MRIELLYVPGCPHYLPARRCIQAALETLGIEAEVIERKVSDIEEAKAIHFPGSPTIRVNGVDVVPASDGNVGLSCRLYNGTGEVAMQTVREAVAKALEQ